MSTSRAAPQKRGEDVSAAQGIVAALGVGLVFLFLKSPKGFQSAFDRLARFSDLNQESLFLLIGVSLFNFIWLGAAIGRVFKPPSQAKKTVPLNSQRPHSQAGEIAWGVGLCTIAGVLAYYLSKSTFKLRSVELLFFPLTPFGWSALFTASAVISVLGWVMVYNRVASKIAFRLIFSSSRLPVAPKIRDGIILGATHEAEDRSDGKKKRRLGLKPAWNLLGLKGLTGNLFIAGVIGSGKSQILLQYLKQLLGNLGSRPSLLAIDPKRTFVRELRRIIETLGLSEHLVWISLEGETRLNPIWREDMLKNSTFTEVANSLKLASINFIGSSGDSRFWEQSSFNLLKSCLIYCAAKYDYFTFKELYRALVQARDQGLASALIDCLSTREWDCEERANIEMAIDYFKDEFSQMDEKLRTSILATATGFMNEFLEYRVSKILSPKRDEINLPSIKEAIKGSKLICLHIENDALARSIGTLVKLLYQEAVLARVGDPEHAKAPYAVLVMDEYQDVATSGGGAGLGDDRYLAKARESKAITIAASQSVSSLENAIRSEPATRELLQNFRSRIFGNSTDQRTIRLFQELRGQEEVERSSHNFSETSPDAKVDLILGGYDSHRSNISQGVSTQLIREYPVTAKEFSRLRTFEAFAQIFDGLETHFEKLYLKPYYLQDLRTSHQAILRDLRASAQVKVVRGGWFGSTSFALTFGLAFGLTTICRGAPAEVVFPNICSVVKASQFESCLDLQTSGCMCAGIPPHPCALISYNVPQTFIEVWPNSKQSFFSKMPGTSAQLSSPLPKGLPFGVDDEQGEYAFHSHALAIPMTKAALMPMPCGGARMDKPCFDLMSEDLGSNWVTGVADKLQPNFLAWGLAPKACLLKGAASSLGGAMSTSIGGDSGGCSYAMPSIQKYPPSQREACNGWGAFYPRTGIYQGGSRSAAALMIASRLKSLGVEVSRTIPGEAGENWQMIYPQSSSCFREGQNLGLLEGAKGVREEQRLLAKPNGYLFVIWKRVSCCQEIPDVIRTQAALLAMKSACASSSLGGL